MEDSCLFFFHHPCDPVFILVLILLIQYIANLPMSGAGCDFVEKVCLVNDGKNPVVPDYGKGYFCTNASEQGFLPLIII